MFISYFLKDGDGYVQLSSCETNKEFFKAMGAVTDVSELPKTEKKKAQRPTKGQASIEQTTASDTVVPTRRRAIPEG